jgi:hypothetical protein
MACVLTDLEMDAVWAEADEREKRVVVENLLAWIKVLPINWKSKSWASHRSTSCSLRLA